MGAVGSLKAVPWGSGRAASPDPGRGPQKCRRQCRGPCGLEQVLPHSGAPASRPVPPRCAALLVRFHAQGSCAGREARGRLSTRGPQNTRRLSPVREGPPVPRGQTANHSVVSGRPEKPASPGAEHTPHAVTHRCHQQRTCHHPPRAEFCPNPAWPPGPTAPGTSSHPERPLSVPR